MAGNFDPDNVTEKGPGPEPVNNRTHVEHQRFCFAGVRAAAERDWTEAQAKMGAMPWPGWARAWFKETLRECLWLWQQRKDRTVHAQTEIDLLPQPSPEEWVTVAQAVAHEARGLLDYAREKEEEQEREAVDCWDAEEREPMADDGDAQAEWESIRGW